MDQSSPDILAADESEIQSRISHITLMAERVFGDKRKASCWLTKPKRRLNGLTPMAVLSSAQGAREIEEMLIQIAEGYPF